MEAELTGMREKMKKLESECVLSISKAHKEGLEKGKDLGKEGAMGEVATQFKMVYNSGFRNGWKSALSKTEQPETSDLYLRAKTPLPYPDAGLNNSDDEAEDEDDEGDEEEKEEEKREEEEKEKEKEEETEEVQGEKNQPQESSQPDQVDEMVDTPELIVLSSNVPAQPPSS
jgi:hypothetical protein